MVLNDPCTRYRDTTHLPIDVVEQGDDKIPCGHAALLFGDGRHADQHGRVVG